MSEENNIPPVEIETPIETPPVAPEPTGDYITREEHEAFRKRTAKRVARLRREIAQVRAEDPPDPNPQPEEVSEPLPSPRGASGFLGGLLGGMRRRGG